MNKYVSVVERVRLASNWCLYVGLKDLNPTQRVECLLKYAIMAVSTPVSMGPLGPTELQALDEGAAVYVDLLFHAIRDEVVLPLTEEKNGVLILKNQHQIEYGQEGKAIQRRCGELATKVYSALLDSSTGYIRNFVAQDEIRMERGQYPSHLKTRTLLMEEIVRTWLDTDDVNLAQILLEYLMNALEKAKYSDYREIILVAQRKFNKNATIQRLESSIRTVGEQMKSRNHVYSPNPLEEFFKTLTMAWMRSFNSCTSATIDTIEVARLLGKEASPSAWALVVKHAKRVSDMEAVGRSIIEHLGGYDRWAISELNEDLNHVTLTKTVAHQHRNLANNAHALAEAVKKAETWVNPHSTITVTLILRNKSGDLIKQADVRGIASPAKKDAN